MCEGVAMETNTIFTQFTQKINTGISHFQEDLKKLRTGRAHPAMLDGVTVEAYGAQMPLLQLGSISTPEPQLLQITPFDPGNLQAIAAAIRDNQSLGLNPVDDGRIIRVQIPPLTTERRQQIVKQLGEKAEECMISLRNARHEAHKVAEQLKKAKSIGEDDFKRFTKTVDDLMNTYKVEVETLSKNKEQEIMTI